MWWLPNILVLTHALLLVHVSEVSGYMRFDQRVLRSGNPQATPQATSDRVMTSLDAVRKFGGRGATLHFVNEEDDIEKAIKTFKAQDFQPAIPAIDSFQLSPLQKPIDSFQQSPWQKYYNSLDSRIPTRPRVVEAAPSYYTRTNSVPPRAPFPSSFGESRSFFYDVTDQLPRSSLSYGENNAPQNPFLGKSISDMSGAPPIQPRISRLSSNLGAPPATSSKPTMPSRPRFSGGQISTFSGTDANSLADNVFNAPHNPLLSKSSSDMFGDPSIDFPSRSLSDLPQPAPSSKPEMPSRPRSSGGQSSTFSGTDANSLADNVFNAPHNPYNGKSTSNMIGAPSIQPQPSRSSSKLGAQTNNTDYSSKYKYGTDGRRIAGRQTETWPVKGTKLNIIDAGPDLGPAFQGILIPQNSIKTIKDRLVQSEKDSFSDVDDHEQGNVQSKRSAFAIQFTKEMYNLIDCDLINKAIREALGDDDDYDNPDPWTYKTIYCPEVLELNKKLHNEFRARHYAQPLEYMDEIHPVAHAYAAKLAREIALYGIDRFQHNKDLQKKNWGENLYTTNSPFDGRSPAKIVETGIRGFYKENENYKSYNEKIPTSSTGIVGHFTALVWRSTSRMGLGLAKYTHNNRTTYVMVVNYYINGNVEGYYDTNVIREGAFDNHMEDLPKAVNPYEPQANNAYENYDNPYGGGPNNQYYKNNPYLGGMFRN